MSRAYKIVVYVPGSHADKVREAMGSAGAGRIGNYSRCTFSVKGVGRFKPEEGAHPAIGETGRLEEVAEERIETVCSAEKLRDVMAAIRAVHPYEEPATDVYRLEGGFSSAKREETPEQYASYRKPAWAPPAWLFGPVWTVLYLLIAVSFGYVGYLWAAGAVASSAALPFALNLVFNLSFTAFQFRWRKPILASIDVALVWATLVWAIAAFWPIAPWVAYVNLPYLAWTTFASALQFSITFMNRKKHG